MDKLSRFDIQALLDEQLLEEEEGEGLEEDEETKEEDKEEGFEVVYSEDEIESIYKDYNDIREKTDKTENQYYLTMKMERKETNPNQKNIDFDLENLEKIDENDYAVIEEKNTNQSEMDILKVEYIEPVFFNEQLTYQSIFMENKETGKTVYELTLESSQRSGMDIKMRYDEKMKTFYLESIDGKMDGSEIDGNKVYLEFWIKDGETNEYRIGENSIEREVLKKGDKVEWRLATERDSYCGGGGYEKSHREKEIEEILLYPNNTNPVAGYFSGLGGVLERNPFFYTDFGPNII